MKNKLLALMVPLLMFSFAGVAAAQGSEKSPWQIRLRAIGVIPDDSAKTTVLGGSADISNDYVPELDITYFFTDHVAVELILGTTKHRATATDTILGDVPLGNFRILPPTLTVQYHFVADGKFRPYIGAGINYSFFFDENPAGGAVTSLAISNSVGLALQVGVDIALDNHWLLNLDVKKLWLDTTAKVNGGAIVSKVNVDPWIVGVGFGYRF